MPLELTKFDAAEYISTPERARAYLEMAIDEDPRRRERRSRRTQYDRTRTEYERHSTGGRARPGRSDQDAIR